MRMQCQICGNSTEVNATHRDYRQYARHEKSAYICDNCSLRIQTEMLSHHEILGNLF